MRFEWDENKNAINIEKHGFDFMQAERVFSGPAPVVIDADIREGYEEERWIAFGMIGDIVAVVAFTRPAPDVLRILSLRKANKNEQSYYYSQAF
jgi:uncharacterized protein